jgi:hypothetical protein
LTLKEPVQTSKYLFTITIVNAFEVWIYCILIVIVFSTVSASGISCNLVFRK